MVETINGYGLYEPLSNKDAGFAKWGRAQKAGEDYFIKELLNPRYPTKDSPYGQAEKRQIAESCRRFESERSLLYKRINEVSDGNLMRVEDFFCWDGRYYVVTRWLEPVCKRDMAGGSSPFRSKGNNLTIEDLSCAGPQVRMRTCLALSHAVMQLHSAKVVHADMKPSNIILTRLPSGGISAKVIDMESSFFESAVPDELIGDQVYFAPESVLRMMGEPGAPPVSCAIDVFAMGLIFHQILAGRLPALPSEFDYAFEACLEGSPPRIDAGIPRGIRGVIADMLKVDAGDRPSMREVYESLWKVVHSGVRVPEIGAPLPEPAREPAREPERKPANISVPETGKEGSAKSRVHINFGSAGGTTSERPGAESAGTGMDEAFYRPKGL